MEGALVNTFGLFCDIIGAVTIWKFTLPMIRRTLIPTGPKPPFGQLADAMSSEWNERAKQNANLRDECDRAWSLFGIVALITGFVLQAISGWL